MGIEANFTEKDVSKRFDAFLRVIESRIIKRLQYLGEKCATHAKSIPPNEGFMDRTGNLRSSIGYMVFKNGIAVREGYEGTDEGMRKGRDLATKVGSRRKAGFSLVVTAGMNYAIYVESKGRDVLTSAEILAMKELPRMLEELKGNINKALDETNV